MALKLLIFSDFVCPFCYIGFETARKLRPEFGFELEWRGFQIHPEWPAEGMPAEKAYQGMSAESRRAAWGRIEEMAGDIGLIMKPPALLTNSRLALEAAEFARETKRDEAFEQRVYRAYFQEGANIGDAALLADFGAEVGLDRGALGEALASGKYALRLKNNALVAHQRGVSGVPTFFIGQFPLVGAQSEDVMRKVLQRAIERLGSAEG